MSVRSPPPTKEGPPPPGDASRPNPARAPQCMGARWPLDMPSITTYTHKANIRSTCGATVHHSLPADTPGGYCIVMPRAYAGRSPAVRKHRTGGGARKGVAEMATSTSTRKRATAGDIAAAVKLGSIDPSAEVVTADELAESRAESAAAVIAASTAASLSSAEHQCGIVGCRHGSAHPLVSQPDRQVKLQCPKCGAVARMTAAAIGRTGGAGIVCGGDGATFAVAARRTYSPRA